MPFEKDLLAVKQTEFDLAPGRILVSSPYYNDLFFNRTVVLLTDYEGDHVAGLILNRKLSFKVCDVVNETHTDATLYLGGPVMPTALFLVHNFDSSKASAQVAPGIYVGYDPILLALIEHKAIPTLKYRFLMGYAGWSPGQLEREVARNMWVVGNPTPELVFNTPADEMWSKIVRILGDDYSHWLHVPEYINMN